MASRKLEQLERVWGDADGTSRPAQGLEGTSDRRPIERLRLRAGVKPHAGVPASGALPSCCCPGPPAHHGQRHRFEDVME